MTLQTLTEWMRFLTGPDRQFEAGGLRVNAFGEGDKSYLVIERQIGDRPRTVNQYVLHSLGGNALFQQVSFLAGSEFDLATVVARLETAGYVAEGFNEIACFEQVEVARYSLRENASRPGLPEAAA